MELNKLIMQFVKDADVEKASKKQYDFAIRKFFRWVQAEKKDPHNLKRSDIINYNTYLKEADMSQSTKKNYFTVVRLYFVWASSNQYHDDVAAGIKSAKSNQDFKKHYLPADKVKELLGKIDRTKEIGARNYAIISIMITNGLRRSEVTSMDIGDITTKYNKLGIMIKGKGRQAKDQFVQLDDSTMDAINDYLVLRYDHSDDRPMFASMNHITKGKRITTSSLSRILKSQLNSINLTGKYYSCHSFRHTAATLLIEAGYDLHQVQRFMRHKSPSTTQLYTRMIDEKISFENPLSKALVKLINTTPNQEHETLNIEFNTTTQKTL